MEKLLRDTMADKVPVDNEDPESKAFVERAEVLREAFDLPEDLGSVEEAEDAFNKVSDALQKLEDEQAS